MSIYKKLLKPKGEPVTTSFIIPAKKIYPYPNCSIFFNVQKKIKMKAKLIDKNGIPK